MSFTFLHAADVHLDSPLRGLSGLDPSVAERIRTATREAFEQLVTRAIEDEVAFVVLAGDLYDGEWRDSRTGIFTAAQLGRLREADIPVFLIHGNHDADSQIGKRLPLPDNVHTFASRRAETVELAELNVAVHGQSFPQKSVTENLVPGYPEPVAGRFNIGVLHTGLGGLGGHENYAPCTLAELLAKGYDYWALGHVHQRQRLHDAPPVVFPGNLQGRHIRETGAKGAERVVVVDGEVTETAQVPLDVVRWCEIPVEVDECEERAGVLTRLRAALEEGVSASAEGRLLACRLRLTGRTSAHDALIADHSGLLEEARALAAGLGDMAAWVERLIVETEPPEDPAALRAREDALGDLARMLPEAENDPHLLARVGSELGALTGNLPPEVRSESEDPVLRAALEQDWASVVREAAPLVLARLRAERE